MERFDNLLIPQIHLYNLIQAEYQNQPINLLSKHIRFNFNFGLKKIAINVIINPAINQNAEPLKISY